MQSTSASALLMASLDHARKQLAVNGRDDDHGQPRGRRQDPRPHRGRRTLRLARRPHARVRRRHARSTRCASSSTPAPAASAATRHVTCCSSEHRIHLEMSTDSVVVAVVGAGAIPDVDRLIDALHSLPTDRRRQRRAHRTARSGRARHQRARRLLQRHRGRRAPTTPSVGSQLTPSPPTRRASPTCFPARSSPHEVVDFLQQTAAAPFGHVRGAIVQGHEPVPGRQQLADRCTRSGWLYANRLDRPNAAEHAHSHERQER